MTAHAPYSPVVMMANWNYGHCLDLRLADIFDEHDVPATFYVFPFLIDFDAVVEQTEVSRLSDHGWKIAANDRWQTSLQVTQDAGLGVQQLTDLWLAAVRNWTWDRLARRIEQVSGEVVSA